MIDLAVHHAYCAYVECIIVHMLSVKKIHGEEDDYDMKLKVSIYNKSLSYFMNSGLFDKPFSVMKTKTLSIK